MARHREIVVRALTWNLFHGRDHPGGAARADFRAPLRDEFARTLAALEWDVALLQEAPPRWFRHLATAAGASGWKLPTSRNQLGVVRGLIADRWPDLIKSGEGGSNQILVRGGWRMAEHRALTLARRPERRRMGWARLVRHDGAHLCVANLHASAHQPARAAAEVERAARTAAEWSGAVPLVFGGDFNVRPAVEPWLFERLERELGFSGPTGPKLIDHLLARGLAVIEPPHQLPAAVRELSHPAGGVIRLSDHAPVAASFGDME